MSIKLLLTDSFSPLGQALLHELEREPIHLIMSSKEQTDWTRREATNVFFREHRPDVVINVFAFDQLYEPEGRQQYIDATLNIAAACGIAGIPLIHVSGYGIFGGDNKSQHGEDDQPMPADAIGEALVEAERHLRELTTKYLCVRSSWLIGPYGNNLLTRYLAGFFEGKPIGVKHSLRGAPTTFADLSRVLVALTKQVSCGAENWGNYHYCSSDICTQEEFIEQLMQLLIQQQLLTTEPQFTIEEETIEMSSSAVLACKRIRDNFGVQGRSWRPSLLPMVKQWLHNREQSQL